MMTTLKDLKADHPYYCSTANYHSSRDGKNYKTWEDFLEEWGDADEDYNFLFRWDIETYEEGDDEYQAGVICHRMEIFFMGQRKGLFIPVTIGLITDEDAQSILEYLQKKWEYMKLVWSPFSNTLTNEP